MKEDENARLRAKTGNSETRGSGRSAAAVMTAVKIRGGHGDDSSLAVLLAEVRAEDG